MADDYEENLQEIAAKVGSYPEDAYVFVREGLNYAVNEVHGPETPAQTAVMRFLAKHRLDLSDLQQMSEDGQLSKSVIQAIEDAGGLEKLNRHVGGPQLCWGLRDYALQRWGILAQTVLDRWNIKSTYDFGRIVFAMIEHNLMQKQPNDSIDDFKDVYGFDQAMRESYQLDFGEGRA